jgi:predicted metal-dependent hydrolase
VHDERRALPDHGVIVHGSLYQDHRLTIACAQAISKTYIDCVIFHELCHLVEPNHSPRYYELLDRVLPDWRERREKLNMFEFG